MKKMLGFLLVTCLGTSLMADFIVLQNGKRFEIDGTYEVKGSLVVFRTLAGELSQVPLKMVDVEASREFTEKMVEHRRKKAEEAERARAEAEKRVVKVGSDISEIAEYVEKNRGEDNPRPGKQVQIGNENLEAYVDANPRVINRQAPRNRSTSERTVEDYNNDRDELGSRYQQLTRELEGLKADLENEKLRKANLESISALDDDFYGPASEADPRSAPVEDDPGASPAYLEMERAEKRIEELQGKIKDKESEIQKTEREARAAGVRDYKRYKKKEGDAGSGGGDDREGGGRN